MSTTWAQSTTLSSASGLSPAIALDPLAKMTAVQITFASTAATAVYVQATLDGNGAWQSGGAGGVLPTPQPLWSVVGSSLGYIVGESSVSGITPADNSAMFVLLQPVAGLRLSTPSFSTSSTPFASGTCTLRALQSPTA